MRVTALDRLWSDHNPILLHCNKADFGPAPFKIYHSLILRECFDYLISLEWANMGQNVDGINILSHEKLKRLKVKIKHWVANFKSGERIHKQEIMSALKKLEEKIEVGSASPKDHEKRIKLIHEDDSLEKLEAMDTVQKALIKWDIGGDENSKFFHSLVNQKRGAQSIHGIMIE